MLDSISFLIAQVQDQQKDDCVYEIVLRTSLKIK